jgi:hypothetical protein
MNGGTADNPSWNTWYVISFELLPLQAAARNAVLETCKKTSADPEEAGKVLVRVGEHKHYRMSPEELIRMAQKKRPAS